MRVNILSIAFVLLGLSMHVKADGLPLKSTYHAKNGSTWVSTGEMKVSGDVVLTGTYMRGLENKPVKGEPNRLMFFTTHEFPIWHDVQSVQITFGKNIVKLTPEYHIWDEARYTSEALTIRVEDSLLKKMVSARKTTFVIKKTSISIYGSNIVTLEKLLESRKWRTTDVTQKTTPPQPKFSSSQRESIKKALAAVRKMEAATKVGVTHSAYSNRLIDAQAEVDECLRSIPDCKVKEEIQMAMKQYVAANTIWQTTAEMDQLTKGNLTNEVLTSRWSEAQAHTRQAEKLLRNK